MTDGAADYATLDGLLRDLGGEVDAMRRAGCQLAENEAEYRMALRRLILAERDRGTPVTVISDICRGDPGIADLRRARDCSEALYRASQEAINVLKLRVRVVDAQIAREWGRAGVS